MDPDSGVEIYRGEKGSEIKSSCRWSEGVVVVVAATGFAVCHQGSSPTLSAKVVKIEVVGWVAHHWGCMISMRGRDGMSDSGDNTATTRG